MHFDPVNNPDGWTKPEPADLAFDGALRERLELDTRIFRQHGRCWLADSPKKPRGKTLRGLAAREGLAYRAM